MKYLASHNPILRTTFLTIQLSKIAVCQRDIFKHKKENNWYKDKNSATWPHSMDISRLYTSSLLIPFVEENRIFYFFVLFSMYRVIYQTESDKNVK